MGHKRILGKTTDFITGRVITDTDDERLRQRLARFLVGEKGYAKEDIEVKRRLAFTIDNKEILSMVDFVVRMHGLSLMVIRYGPGSLVTRERPALASARILEPYPVPLTVVTNGEDAEVLETVTSEIIGTGLDSIPHKKTLEARGFVPSQPLSAKQREAEERILFAYDWLEHSLECDDDWCAPD